MISLQQANVPGAGQPMLAASAWFIVGLALGVAPLWLDSGTLRLLTEWLCLLALAQMWNLLAGYTGLASMGQQGFVGLGAYALVALGLLAEWPLWAVGVAAPVAAALVAWPAGVLLFRLKGAYFAVGSWVVAEVLRLGVAAIPQVAGGSGISVAPLLNELDADMRFAMLFELAALAGLGSTVAVWWLLRSRWGLALRAVRDSEMAAETLGVSVPLVRWWVWLACAALSGFVGFVLFMAKLRVSPDTAFSIEWTTLMLFAVVVGGMGTVWGPVLGVAVYVGLREWLAEWGSGYLISLGVIIMAATLWLPDGLWGAIRRWRPLVRS